MKLRTKLAAIALLFVALVLINYLASKLPVRLDATAEKIYTLSPGTRAILAKVEEPLTIDLYFSKSIAGQEIQYKNYAERVQEMLRQYVRASHGKITLNVVDPKPDTPAEEKATAAGIEARLHHKDFRIVLDEAHALGSPLPIAAQVWQQLNALMAQGMGKDDTSSLLKVMERMSGG